MGLLTLIAMHKLFITNIVQRNFVYLTASFMCYAFQNTVLIKGLSRTCRAKSQDSSFPSNEIVKKHIVFISPGVLAH